MSVDEQSANNIQRRISRTAKLSLASKEDLINSRRVSRAAIHFTETGDFGFTLVEQLKLTRLVFIFFVVFKRMLIISMFKQLMLLPFFLR